MYGGYPQVVLIYPGEEGGGVYGVQKGVVVEIHGGFGHDETGSTLKDRSGVRWRRRCE